MDYVLPDINMNIVTSGVYWPVENGSNFKLVGDNRVVSSDHRLVWIDITPKKDL